MKEKNELIKKTLKKTKADVKEITALSRKSLKELERIAFDEEVQLKIRTDILRWITELSFGKGGKALEEDKKDNKLDIRIHVEK